MTTWTIVRPGWAGVTQGLLVPALPCLAIWSLTLVIDPAPIPPDIDWLTVFRDSVLIAPLMEAVILWVSCDWAQRRWGAGWLAVFVGALPINLLHLPLGWQRFATMFPFFLWASWYWIQRTAAGDPPTLVYARLALTHAIWNVIALVGAYVLL